MAAFRSSGAATEVLVCPKKRLLLHPREFLHLHPVVVGYERPSMEKGKGGL